MNKKMERSKIKTILILDNCLSEDLEWIHDESILELFYNSRLYWITLITITRYSFRIPSEIMSNYDYMFLFNDDFIYWIEII